MATVRVTHTIGDLARDCARIAKKAPADMDRVTRMNAQRGNRIAKSNASEQHTMHGDEDITYAPSFTVEKLAPRLYEYGPDASIGDGSKASGYEFGSVNSPPHFDLARSVDVVSVLFPKDVSKVADRWFW